MFSIICVYNDKYILKNWLLSSLENQRCPFQLLLLNNKQYRYSCAAKALNVAGKEATGDYIMFIHQDCYLIGGDWLNKAERFLNSLNTLGVAGVAGMVEEGRRNIERGRNLILHGSNKQFWEWGNKISKPAEVQTLDECLIIIPKNVFNKVKFDERTCQGWHLYAVEYCLTIKRLGLKAYVLPLKIWHRSKGEFDKSYFYTLHRISIKHRDAFEHLYTTMGDWPLKGPKYYLKIILWLVIYLLIKRMLKQLSIKQEGRLNGKY
jgi:hypothetical protein